MGENTNNYRVHITVRRRKEPVFDSIELKTENCDSLDDLIVQAAEYINGTIDEDMEGSDDSGNN